MKIELLEHLKSINLAGIADRKLAVNPHFVRLGYLNAITFWMAAGWQGDPRLVRLGFTAAMLRVRATNVLRILESISDEGQARGRLLKNLHTRQQSLKEWSESVALIQPYVRQLFEESLDLRAELSMD